LKVLAAAALFITSKPMPRCRKKARCFGSGKIWLSPVPRMNSDGFSAKTASQASGAGVPISVNGQFSTSTFGPSRKLVLISRSFTRTPEALTPRQI